ncbi:hypothetical protein N7520_002127 [Penicillium odoratum]|uniref:uncharacterized protein n=1 Tax=Penicillium odoratum TaxID=1167516 RepID=UPI00254737E6|nr:uncharacterized protein N7520_002127 [Penicillium odoratum]KAJ5771598.1 hypothetical protein N7520_002127 [Penicillium odoratum]
MASRLEIDTGEETGASNIARDARIERLFLDATDIALDSPSTILQQFLSLRSVISTTSSFSIRFQKARFEPHLQAINQIGGGLQGTILEVIWKDHVLKKENIGNESRHSNLRREF